MKRKLKIALDVDGVLADYTAGALRVIEEVTGRRYVSADVTEFDIIRSLGLSEGEGRAYMEAITTRQFFAATLSPYPNARQGVRQLRALGDVFCVTAPSDFNPWWRAERDAWCATHFGIDVVHHAEDKSMYEADVFVDDRSKHVNAWLGAWPDRTAVFWRTPHNVNETVPLGAHSIGSWAVLYQVVLEVACAAALEDAP